MFEKKNGKRFLASVMALVMLLSLAPVGALAADEETPEENTAVTLPAVEGSTPAVVDTPEDGETTNSDTDNGVATLPLLDESRPVVDNSEAAILPEEDLFDKVFNLDSIDEYKKGDNNQPTTPVATTQYTAYFYALLPNVVLPNDYSANEWWYGMGTGSIDAGKAASEYGYNGIGTKLNEFLNGDKITYPETYPSLAIDNVTYTYDATATKENSYSIIWNDVLVSNGANIGVNKYNPLVPSNKEGYSDNNTYHVDGTIVLNEAKYSTVMFKYQAPDSAVFEEVQGKTVRVQNGYKESDLRQPEMDKINGYEFDGWYRDEQCTERAEFDSTIDQNTTYYGKYIVKTCTVIWKNGEVTLETDTDVAYNSRPSYDSAAPTKAEDDLYTYEFAGWSADKNAESGSQVSELPKVTGNVTYYAVFEKTAKTYTVTWKNGEDTLETDTGVAYNSDPSYDSAEPTKAEDDLYTYEFAGWSTDKNAESGSQVSELPKVTGNVTYYAVFKKTAKETPPEPVADLNYKIIQHFRDAKGNEIEKLRVDSPRTITAADAAVITSLNTLVEKEGMAKNMTDASANNYVYVPNETTFKADGKDVTTLIEGTQIDLYYYLDNWKDADTTEDTSDKDSETGGDGIPDCDQVLIKYVSSNSERGTVSPDMEVLTIRKGNETFVPTANGSTATTTGSSRNYFSNWTKDNTQVSTNATLDHQTILGVIKEFTGGETYIFTANFGRSSGGNSRPSDSIVDIPDDDVPTGLNGADHYAYIIGYGNNDVRPQQSITRAEVATIFFRLLTDETREANMTKNQNYSDVKDSDWYCRAVATLSSMGIIKGYEDGTFQPNAPITRAEFAAIAARFDPDGDTTPATFSDVGSHWAKDEISIAANHGWINGYEDGTFKPDRNITRAEAVTLINRVLKRLPETKEDLHEDMKTWVDNMDETAWYYLAIQEATNGHYNTNKEGTQYETWTDLRENRDWSELEK